MNPEPTSRRLEARSSRLDHITDLLKALDTTIFIQIAIAYYLDGLTFLLLLRAVAQYFYIQAGPVIIVPQLPPVLAANIICIITHLLHAPPEAIGRGSRGYLHGGLIIDMIGEKGPIPKSRLLLQDLLILGLQFIMLAIAHERSVMTLDKPAAPSQDIDAEEAGVRRSQEGAEASGETEEGIEMQSMTTDTRRAKSSTVEVQDDIVLTLSLRRSLGGLLTRKEPAEEASESNTVADRAADRAESLRRVLLARIAAVRAAR